MTIVTVYDISLRIPDLLFQEEVTTVSSMNYADNMMQVTLIAAHHNILTVQVTIYGFLEPRIISTRDQPSEPVAFKIVPHTQQV